MASQLMVAVSGAYQSSRLRESVVGWAERLGGAVIGFGVVDESVWAPAPVTLGVPVVEPGAEQQSMDARRARAEELIEESLGELRDHCRQAGVAYREVRTSGKPQEDIILESQCYDVTLLGRPQTADPGLGVPARTILTEVLRHTPRPVVVVPDGVEQDDQQRRGIVVAYDGSLQAARALQGLIASGLAALGSVEVLSVDGESEDVAQAHAHRAAAYLTAHDIEVRKWCEVSDEAPGDVIVRRAENSGSELAVMGAYGSSRLAEFFVGSTTTRVIEQSSIPVMLFH